MLLKHEEMIFSVGPIGLREPNRTTFASATECTIRPKVIIFHESNYFQLMKIVCVCVSMRVCVYKNVYIRRANTTNMSYENVNSS